jgi:hypothetical protein
VVASKHAILKVALLKPLSLTVTPFYATTEDRVTILVGLVEGRADTSEFLLTDGAGELPCKAGPSADNS